MIIFAPEARGLEPLTEGESALVSWFARNEPKVSDAVKAALIEWCAPRSSDHARRFDLACASASVRDEGDLKRKVGLHTVNIHQLSTGSIPYIGFEFGCEWDDHGVGVLMHGTRPVRIGHADTAFLLWIAEQDAEQHR